MFRRFRRRPVSLSSSPLLAVRERYLSQGLSGELAPSQLIAAPKAANAWLRSDGLRLANGDGIRRLLADSVALA